MKRMILTGKKVLLRIVIISICLIYFIVASFKARSVIALGASGDLWTWLRGAFGTLIIRMPNYNYITIQ